MRSILLDAGPQIALFAVDDKFHHHYNNLIFDFSANGLRLITTWPCVVEASYLLGVPQRYELLRWIELGGVIVYPFSPHHLADIVGWMKITLRTANGKWTSPTHHYTGLLAKRGYVRS